MQVHAEPPQWAGRTQSDQALRKAARQLEATFLHEMLKSVGLGEARDAFGGGVGEEQFASLLQREQAERMVRSGGIGLAEQIFLALKKADST